MREKKRITHKRLVYSFIGLGFAVGAVAGLLSIQKTDSTEASPRPVQELSILDQKKAIAEEYEQQLDRAISSNNIEEAKRLNEEMLARIDALVARSEGERTVAVQNIRSIAGSHDLEVEYVATLTNPYRISDHQMESYRASNGMQYYVDQVTDNVIQMGVAPTISSFDEGVPQPKEIDLTPRYNQTDLENMAVDFAQQHAESFSSQRHTLELVASDKEGLVHFFRWNAEGTDDVPARFLQVGITIGGEVVNFVNTLQLN